MASVSFNNHIKNDVIPRARMHAQKVINENPGLTETQLRELFTESYNKYADTLTKSEIRAAYKEFGKVYNESLRAMVTPTISKEAQEIIDRLNKNSGKIYHPEMSHSGKTHQQWLDELNNAVEARKGCTDKEIVDALINDAKGTADLKEAEELIKASGTKEQKMAFVRKYKELEKIEKNVEVGKAQYNQVKNILSQKSEFKPYDFEANLTGKTRGEWLDELSKAAGGAEVTIGGNVKEVVKETTEKAAEAATEAAADAGKKAGEAVADVAEDAGKKVGEVADDVAKEGGKVAEKMKGKWGWVIAGAVVLIGAIAAITKSNKNKQQQLNAVA